MRNRTSLMVAKDILVVAIGGSNKTRLVYRSNLNFKLIKTWLSRLIAKGLIESSSTSRTWTTTQRGVEFILAMDEVMAIWAGGAPPNGKPMIEMGMMHGYKHRKEEENDG